MQSERMSQRGRGKVFCSALLAIVFGAGLWWVSSQVAGSSAWQRHPRAARSAQRPETALTDPPKGSRDTQVSIPGTGSYAYFLRMGGGGDPGSMAQIHRVNLRTKTSEPLPVLGMDPSISPDGTKLAYDAFDREGDSQGLWILHVRSGQKKQVSSDGSAAQWSGDSKRISFFRVNPSRFHILNLSNGKTKPLRATPAGRATRWSRDGRFIAFIAEGDRASVGSGGRHVVVFDRDGKLVRRIPSGNKILNPGPFSWAPHGRQLYVSATDPAGARRVYSVDLRTAAIVPLSSGRADARPAGSVDGRWIAYSSLASSDGKGRAGLRVLSLGQSKRVIAFEDLFDPVWCLDGKFLVAEHRAGRLSIVRVKE
jgi:Tol biopolymer transport system component